MKKDKHGWILVAIIAAAVAAATTIVVLYLRHRQKAAKLSEPIYDCGSCDETECVCDCDTEENAAE